MLYNKKTKKHRQVGTQLGFKSYVVQYHALPVLLVAKITNYCKNNGHPGSKTDQQCNSFQLWHQTFNGQGRKQ